MMPLSMEICMIRKSTLFTKTLHRNQAVLLEERKVHLLHRISYKLHSGGANCHIYYIIYKNDETRQPTVHVSSRRGRGFMLTGARSSAPQFPFLNSEKLKLFKGPGCQDGCCYTAKNTCIHIWRSRLQIAARLSDCNLRSWLLRCSMSVGFLRLHVIRTNTSAAMVAVMAIKKKRTVIYHCAPFCVNLAHSVSWRLG